MNARFAECLRQLEPKFRELTATAPVKMHTLPKSVPDAGVYLFSEKERNLYVERTANIRGRLRNHCRGNHNAASFAFLLAREKTGSLQPTYQKRGSRVDLMCQESFKAVFFSQIERVKQMDVRFVEEADPVRQMLLEVYVAIALDTPYNKFKTT